MRNISLFWREEETGPTVPWPSGEAPIGQPESRDGELTNSSTNREINKPNDFLKLLHFRHLSNEDAGNYKVVVKNKHGEKANHVRLSMKDENAPKTEGIEPTFFRKPTSRQVKSVISKMFLILKHVQEGKRLHLECEIEALPRPEISWFLGDTRLEEGEKYSFYRAIQPSNPNIHFVRLTISVSRLS